MKTKGCLIYGDKKIRKIFKSKINFANKKSWSKEYLSSKISAKVVKNINEAIKHINQFGTMHTDAIITSDKNTARYFLKGVKAQLAFIIPLLNLLMGVNLDRRRGRNINK